MRLPRDLDAQALIRVPARMDCRVTRRTRSHLRLQKHLPPEHAITVPNHPPLGVGTLAAMLSEVARHHGMSRDELLHLLFGG